MRFRLRTLLVGIAVLGVMLALAREAAKQIYPSIIYGVYAEFTELPEDDAALEQWLRDQAGVVDHTVHVNRQQNGVHAVWIMSRNLMGDPPIPDLQNNFERFGYKNLKRFERR